jgi:hypothetical protein
MLDMPVNGNSMSDRTSLQIPGGFHRQADFASSPATRSGGVFDFLGWNGYFPG